VALEGEWHEKKKQAMCVCAPLGHLILHSNLFKAKGIFYCALCFNFLARRCRNNGHHARSLLAFQLHCFLPHLFFCCHRVCMYVYPLFITLARTCTHTHRKRTGSVRGSCQRGKILRMCHILSQIFTAWWILKKKFQSRTQKRRNSICMHRMWQGLRQDEILVL